MKFNEVDQNEFADILGMGSGEDAFKPFKITGTEDETDILGLAEEVEETDPLTTQVQTEVQEENEEDVDILGQGEEKPEEADKKPGRKPKYDFSDISGYFQDRFKANKLIPIVGEDDNPIELKTPEDFDLVIEENIKYQVEQKAKELEKTWYEKKSPAWKAIAQYAEYVQNPTELVPFLQGVDNIQTVSQVDENTLEGAEQIVRYQKQLAGTPTDVIEEEIEALKSTDKLISSASKIKPALIQREERELARMQQEAQQREIQYWTLVQEYEKKARTVIDAPLFGKVKLPNEEKAEIYDLIAVPNEESGGYAIYSEIDKLYENADFETLREVALLLKKKDKYQKYVSQREVQKTGQDLQRKIRLATESKTSSGGMDDVDEQEQPVIKAKLKPFNSRG
jgi:hypothetical protein